MEISLNDLEERERHISEAKSLGFLDAAFLCYYYNHFRKRWGPGEKPLDIRVSEIMPSVVSEVAASAMSKCEEMFSAANLPAMASLGYSEITISHEEALKRFKHFNPGFSEDSYALALHAAIINNR
jgi:hypothetical protein